jgi:MFS family permease
VVRLFHLRYRFLQGFALGGEWGGAVLMSVEHAPQGRRGLFGSFVALGLPAGIILSNLVFLIASTVVSPAQFAAWAWRVPFLASSALVLVGLFMRLRIAESPIFAEVLHARSTRRMMTMCWQRCGKFARFVGHNGTSKQMSEANASPTGRSE